MSIDPTPSASAATTPPSQDLYASAPAAIMPLSQNSLASVSTTQVQASPRTPEDNLTLSSTDSLTVSSHTDESPSSSQYTPDTPVDDQTSQYIQIRTLHNPNYVHTPPQVQESSDEDILLALQELDEQDEQSEDFESESELDITTSTLADTRDRAPEVKAEFVLYSDGFSSDVTLADARGLPAAPAAPVLAVDYISTLIAPGLAVDHAPTPIAPGLSHLPDIHTCEQCRARNHAIIMGMSEIDTFDCGHDGLFPVPTPAVAPAVLIDAKAGEYIDYVYNPDDYYSEGNEFDPSTVDPGDNIRGWSLSLRCNEHSVDELRENPHLIIGCVLSNNRSREAMELLSEFPEHIVWNVLVRNTSRHVYGVLIPELIFSDWSICDNESYLQLMDRKQLSASHDPRAMDLLEVFPHLVYGPTLRSNRSDAAFTFLLKFPEHIDVTKDHKVLEIFEHKKMVNDSEGKLKLRILQLPTAIIHKILALSYGNTLTAPTPTPPAP